MKPKLKPPGTKRLKLKHENPLSSFAFNFNLRRYRADCGGAHSGAHRGRAVQVDPIKPTLKAPKSKLSKLAHEKVLSNCAFKFHLHRSIEGYGGAPSALGAAFGLPPHMVGRCRLTLSNPC
jgi:hypothetical protein